MTKEQKIEFLKGVCNGTRSISELAIDGAPLLDYDYCSSLELYKLLKILRKFGDDPIDKWPQEEKDYLEWLKKDVLLREPRPPFSERKKFDCRHLSGELIVIRYKDPNKKPLFQLEYGYNSEEHPNVIFPAHNRYFEHFDLNEWRPDTQFDKLTDEEFEQICVQLINEKELLNP